MKRGLKIIAGGIAKWLERLSLDAVLVATGWGWGLANLAGRRFNFWLISILALATWLTYLADRLWDVRPGTSIPATDRHRFYAEHFRLLAGVWLLIFPFSVVFAQMVLPLWKFKIGVILVGIILIYLAFIRIRIPAVSRLLLKRVSVALIFTAGVSLIAESWRTLEALAGTGILFNGALVNLFSLPNAKVSVKGGSLRRASRILAGTLFIAGFGIIPISMPVGAAGLTGGLLFFLNDFDRGNQAASTARLRLDGILFLMGGILVLSTASN